MAFLEQLEELRSNYDPTVGPPPDLNLDFTELFEPILESIKSTRETSENSVVFNGPFITYINSALTKLSQIGVCPNGFVINSMKLNSEDYDLPSDKYIVGSNTLWIDLVIEDTKQLGEDHGMSVMFALRNIKTFISLTVGLLFDPPSNSSMISLIQQEISEMEWRILVLADDPIKSDIAEYWRNAGVIT